MQRDQALAGFLSEYNARCLWQSRIPRVGLLDCYAARGRTFLVMTYARHNGFELYIPSHDGNSTGATLHTAANVLTARNGPTKAERERYAAESRALPAVARRT